MLSSYCESIMRAEDITDLYLLHLVEPAEYGGCTPAYVRASVSLSRAYKRKTGSR